MKTLPITILALSTLALGLGCGSRVDPLFCDETTGCELADKPFCDIDKLYSAELTNECIATPDPDACNRVEPCTDATKSKCDSVDVGTTGKCVECTGDTDCPGASCDTSGTCVGFSCTPGAEGDTVCLAVDSTEPLCVEADTCGQCDGTDDATQCPEPTASACDTATYTCRGCIDHDECSSEACNIDTGTCLDEGVIVHVAASGGNDSAVCGSPAAKCATIAFALSDRVDVTRNTVIVAAGNYSDALAVNAGTVTIIGRDEPVVNTGLDGTNPAALTVSGTANLTIDGVNVIPASGTAGTDAIVCTGAGATLSVTRATVSNAEDLGVVADNCSLTLTQSTIFGNDGGGLDLNNSSFTIENNFIAYNGGSATNHSGVEFVGSGSPQLFNFNTVVGNQVASGTSGLSCNTISPVAATGNIIYSALGGASLSLANNCTHTYSDIRKPGIELEPGVGNINENPLLVNDSAISGNYHLGTGSPCLDVADPAATLEILAVDIDGEDRFVNGRSDMGADEVQ